MMGQKRYKLWIVIWGKMSTVCSSWYLGHLCLQRQGWSVPPGTRTHFSHQGLNTGFRREGAIQRVFLFICFWLCWDFVAAPAFLSLWPVGDLLSTCRAWAYCCGGFSCCGARTLERAGSVVVFPGLQGTGAVAVAHAFSCSMPCGIFLDQGSHPHLLHWQVDSLPLSHQQSPESPSCICHFSNSFNLK